MDEVQVQFGAMCLEVKQEEHKKRMKISVKEASQSKDPVTKVGATLFNRSGDLLGSGYNTMPRGCDNYSWEKNEDELENKHTYVVHAEANALLSHTGSAKDSILYVTLFPCNECTKLILQKEVSEVVYLSDKHADKPKTRAAKKMLNSANVKYWQLTDFVIEPDAVSI